MYMSFKQTYYESSNKEILTNFFAFFVTSNNIMCDVSINLRPYGVLIGMKNRSLEKYLNDSKFL